MNINGLIYLKNFISEEEEKFFVEEIDKLPWLNDLKRRVQHYGYKYNYTYRKIDESMRVDPIPEFFNDIKDRLVKTNIFKETPDQLIINEYLPGQGIALHVDCEPCFKESIATISLNSEYIMDLASVDNKEKGQILLERCSLLGMLDEARYDWRHGIKARKEDNGKPRGRRISLTFRNVIL